MTAYFAAFMPNMILVNPKKRLFLIKLFLVGVHNNIKRRDGFLRIFTLAFLLVLAPAGQSLTLR